MPGGHNARRCRLCEARLESNGAVVLAVPRGVHFFLRADELATDAGTTMEIISCRYCGHLQSLDEPVIYESKASSATYVSVPLLAARRQQAERTFSYAPRVPKSVLEIGCGDGRFLAEMSSHFECVLGIEPSAENAARAREHGITVDQQLLDEDTTLSGAPFDAFFAFHVLEHVPDVKAFLRGIRNNLSSDAVGCIEVPSSEAAYENHRFGHFMTDHLSYFFECTLRQAVEMSGFEVIALERTWGGEHLVAFVRARAADLHQRVPDWVESTMAKLTAFLAYHTARGESVAFWGASNPILPVLMHLSQALPYIVIDKAPTKHGLHAPASHVTIRHPDELRARKIDYVVITAPRFYDEIIAEMRATFDADVETINVDIGVAGPVCRLTWHTEGVDLDHSLDSPAGRRTSPLQH